MDVMKVVKGLARRVIVVRFPDTRAFEQAIFIMRDDAQKAGVSADELVAEATSVARRYVMKPMRLSKLRWLPALLGVIIGGAFSSALWFLVTKFIS